MRRLLPVLVALVVLSVPSALAATRTVDITQAGFTPNKVTIDFGDTVTWTNKDISNHQVLADQAAFPTSPVLAANQTYSHTFTKSGSFGYRDAFNTNRRGTVVVRAGLSMTASAAQVVYGGSVTLSGTVSSGAAGETVTIDAMDCGKTAFSRVASVRSAASGAWSYAAKPTLNTVYRSKFRTATSAQLAEKVAPLVSLARIRVGRFSASVTAAQSFAGKYVVLQRYVRTSAGLEDGQARHASHGEGRHRADDDQLGRLPGARDSWRSAPAAPHSAAGGRLLPARAKRGRPRLINPSAEQLAARKGRSLLDRGCYSHKILTARTHLLNLQPVPYIAVKPLRGNRQ